MAGKLVPPRLWKFNMKLHGEKVTDKVSKTVPGEAMSIRYLLEHHTVGWPEEIQRQGVDDPLASWDSDDLEKSRHLDLVDKEALRERLAARQELLTKIIEEDRKTKAAAQKADKDLLDEMKLDFKSKKGKAAGQGDAQPPKPGNGGPSEAK